METKFKIKPILSAGARWFEVSTMLKGKKAIIDYCESRGMALQLIADMGQSGLPRSTVVIDCPIMEDE